MSRRLLGLVPLVGIVVGVVLGCSSDPPHPAPIPVGDECERAQARLVELGCEWRVNAKGGTWASSCHYLADTGYPRVVDVASCVAVATSCTGAKSCR